LPGLVLSEAKAGKKRAKKFLPQEQKYSVSEKATIRAL